MAETLSLKTPIFSPQSPLKEHHHRTANLAALVAIGAIIVGFLYWFIASQRTEIELPASSNLEARRQAEIAALLSRVPVSQANADEVDRLVNQLSSKPKTSASALERDELFKRFSSN
jgi:hypothetical protein